MKTSSLAIVLDVALQVATQRANEAESLLGDARLEAVKATQERDHARRLAEKWRNLACLALGRKEPLPWEK